MVRLNLQGIWIDLLNPTFELKWKHPIQNSLNGSNSTYSTDITAPLTTNNRLAFDYKIFTESTKTNIYLYGVLYVNGTAMRVRAFVRNFASSEITFYLEQFLTGGTAELLKDETTLDNLFLPQIQAETNRDVLMNVATGDLYLSTLLPGTSLLNFFNVRGIPYIDAAGVLQDSPGRPGIYISSAGLFGQIEALYGVTLNNEPTGYEIFSNQWKVRSTTANKATGTMSYAETGGGINQKLTSNSVVKYNLYFDGTDIISPAPFKYYFASDITISNPSYLGTIIFAIYNSSDLIVWSGRYEMPTDGTVPVINFATTILPAGTYYLKLLTQPDGSEPLTISGYFTHELAADYSALEIATTNYNDYTDFGLAGFYPCWQNLPKVTVKEIIETIALCAGKMVEYLDDSINFIDFIDVFAFASAIDVSDKLINWKTKSFTFLQSRNATVVYGDGTVIANILVNDPTLPDTVNNVATINAIRIQQDNGVDRVTDKVILTQTPDSHFEIIDELAKIYAPAVNPRMFEADFVYFEDSKKPLLIRQLGGIFIAIESLITTANTITLQLLKIK